MKYVVIDGIEMIPYDIFNNTNLPDCYDSEILTIERFDKVLDYYEMDEEDIESRRVIHCNTIDDVFEANEDTTGALQNNNAVVFSVSRDFSIF